MFGPTKFFSFHLQVLITEFQVLKAVLLFLSISLGMRVVWQQQERYMTSLSIFQQAHLVSLVCLFLLRLQILICDCSHVTGEDILSWIYLMGLFAPVPLAFLGLHGWCGGVLIWKRSCSVTFRASASAWRFVPWLIFTLNKGWSFVTEVRLILIVLFK